MGVTPLPSQTLKRKKLWERKKNPIFTWKGMESGQR